MSKITNLLIILANQINVNQTKKEETERLTMLIGLGQDGIDNGVHSSIHHNRHLLRESDFCMYLKMRLSKKLGF